MEKASPTKTEPSKVAIAMSVPAIVTLVWSLVFGLVCGPKRSMQHPATQLPPLWLLLPPMLLVIPLGLV